MFTHFWAGILYAFYDVLFLHIEKYMLYEVQLNSYEWVEFFNSTDWEENIGFLRTNIQD